MRRARRWIGIGAVLLCLAACGGGSNGSTAATGVTPPVTVPTPSPTTGGLLPVPAQVALTADDVNAALARAVAEAQARSLPAVIAVTDRVGNVLAVYTMTGARPTTTTRAAPSGNNTDLQNVAVPAAAAAIAKAITGAYLSSNGNAFSTRTASEIVQPEFPPSANTQGLESGPLFGVQFSQLPCSDLSQRYVAGGGPGAFAGPKRSPLGLAADPGGFPLYKNGTLVGGVGVVADGDYGFDPEITDVDRSDEEAIALAATVGLDAPAAILANMVSLDGTTLRYSDTLVSDLKSNPAAAAAPAAAAPAAGAGGLTAITGYFAGAVIAGTPYGVEASGIRPVTAAEFSNSDAFLLTDGAGTPRYPIRAATDGAALGAGALTAAEVRTTLENAFTIMVRARAAIRRPLDARAEVTITVVDTNGVILGQVRGADAPIFGTDVSAQKARTVAFFSGSYAGSDLLAATLPTGAPDLNVSRYVAAVRTFLNNPAALTGTIAFSESAIGNLSRPYFPDGELGTPNGPFSRPIQDFNPFSTGLQTALIVQNVVEGVLYLAGASPTDTPRQCTFLPDSPAGTKRLANGEQIFPGGVPIYRGATLVGGIGVSGDGIDQDNMIAFLGLHNAGVALGTIGNAPMNIRADLVEVATSGGSTRLRYVNCPFAPFVDTADQNVCQGL